MKLRINKRVVVAVDLAYPAGQRHIEGLLRYLRTHRIQWDLRIKRNVSECLAANVDTFPSWNIDGVIYAQSQLLPEARDALAHLLSLDLPLVLIDPGDNPSITTRQKNLVIISTNPDSIGEAAASSFLAQGRCRSFGYVPDILNRSWSQKRGNAFKADLEAHGASCQLFTPKSFNENDFDELCSWLKTLPKPAGILVAYDDRALTVIEACFATGLSIPHDISLLSVNDDTMLCENCRPTLSSIRPDQEHSGYAAGAHLSSLMRKGCERAHILQLPVKSITHRGSTLADSYAGQLVQKALAYIRRNRKHKICPATIAEHLGVSRALLDLRFRELLNTSVGKTIISERLGAVCSELKDSSASISEIADRFGYANASQLMRQFKHKYGMTARTYRLVKGNVQVNNCIKTSRDVPTRLKSCPNTKLKRNRTT